MGAQTCCMHQCANNGMLMYHGTCLCPNLFCSLLCNPYTTLQNPTYILVICTVILPGIQNSLEYFPFTSPMLLPRIDDGYSNPIYVPGGFPFACQRFPVIFVSIISIYFKLILLCKPDRLWITWICNN